MLPAHRASHTYNLMIALLKAEIPSSNYVFELVRLQKLRWPGRDIDFFFHPPLSFYPRLFFFIRDFFSFFFIRDFFSSATLFFHPRFFFIRDSFFIRDFFFLPRVLRRTLTYSGAGLRSRAGNMAAAMAGEDIEDITRWREDMNFMFEWQEQYHNHSPIA